MLNATRSLILASVIVCSGPALAYEFPKKGQAEYDTYYVFNDIAKLESGDAKSGITRITGITRNVAGPGPFNDMSVECLMHWTVISAKWVGYGSCIETDRTGDVVFTTFDSDNHYIVGGTGKYKGITGKARYTVDELRPLPNGQGASIVKHMADWEIK
jgi:hypothetical protein